MKKTRLYGAAFVAALWLALAVFAWVKPAGDISEAERRPLQQFPELSAQMGYSASRLTKMFKRDTGMTINEYLLSERIAQAKDALRLSGESVQNICHRLGFGSQSYFGKQFKRATGMTPLEYREKQGQAV